MEPKACWYQIRNGAGNMQWYGGQLHAWSVDHRDYPTGPGHFPVGVVQDESTGLVYSIPIAQISLGAIPKQSRSSKLL